MPTITNLTELATAPGEDDVSPVVNLAAPVGSRTKKIKWSTLKAALKAVNDVLYPLISGTPTSGQALLYNGSVWVPSNFPNKNLLINGGMNISQRGTSFTSVTTPANNDDTFLIDRWLLLSDGNDIVDVTQSTERPTTLFAKSIALDVETANKKFGIFQPLEFLDSEYVIGSEVIFSFYAKVSAITKLDNIKAGIVSWASTADTITSDIVSAWNAEGANPTLAVNWTFENTPANLSVTTSWARYTVTATIDTVATTNIGVFIWSDVTDTTLGDFLYITGCKLEVGAIATPFEFRSHAQELVLCQRYYQRSGFPLVNCYVDGVTNIYMERASIGSMRIAPVHTVLTTPSYVNCGTLNYEGGDINMTRWRVSSAGAGFTLSFGGDLALDAEL